MGHHQEPEEQTMMDFLSQLLRSLGTLELTLLSLVPVFLLFLAAEAWHFRGRAIFRPKDTAASMSLGALYLLADAFLMAILVLVVYDFVYQHRLFTVEMNALTGTLLFGLVEFCYYGFHRASHRIRWFWTAHVAHHSSEYMNFGTAMRQSPIYSLVGNWLFYLPVVWLGFAPEAVLLMLGANLIYQYFIHTQWVGKLHPVIEFVFNTPSHHRAHHGRNPRYIDRNYGGILILFDRLFGTFVEESADEPVDYGITNQPRGFNPLWHTVHELVDLIRDMARPGPLGQRLKHLWAPPEWERETGEREPNYVPDSG
jgi:sterol desaturase/sphingolipid hydroxylase (fatty acid hydroxylase superfamily)